MISRTINQRFGQTTKLTRFFSDFDLCVIGGGPGGYVAAIRAAQNGLKTVCVEGRGALGGTCLNVGCIPSKSLLNVSHHYHTITHASDYGLSAGQPSFDWGKIQVNKNEVVKGLTGGIQHLFKKNGVEYVQGWGKIANNSTVDVSLNAGGSKSLKTKNILIATGSEPTAFPGIQFDEKIFISSTGALSLTQVPKTMTIIGAGIIGLELGSVYARFGTEVTVVEFADKVCPVLDDDINKYFSRALKKQGLKFKLQTKVLSGKVVNGKAELTVEPVKGGDKEVITSDVCLVAIGRKPFTQGLGAESAGIIINKKGQVEINDHFQTSVPNIYAIGDVVTGPMLAHKSEEEAVACVDLLAGKHGHINYNTIPSVVYTHPEVAWVGKTEQELKAAGVEYATGAFPMVANSRARANMESDGLVKLLSDKKTSRLIGAHIIGSNAGELIHELVLGMEYGASAEDIARTCHAHPTLSEAVKEAALALSFKPIHI